MFPEITVQIMAPAAKSVCVVGTFNDWRIGATPLQFTPPGRWHARLKLPPGRYEYLFVVDGCWVPDPAASETVQNPFGGLNSIMRVA